MSAKTIDAARYDTDKAEHAHYLRNYEQYFRPLWGKDIRLLELGVLRGGSLLMWRDHFERGLVVGLDVQPVQVEDPSGRVRVYQGEQQDTELLDRIARETAPEGFDVIIDDCSHVGELTRITFWHLFDKHLKPGGLYVIEDWSAGYWDGWHDGVSFKPTGRPAPFRRTGFRLRSAPMRLYNSALARRLPPLRRLAVWMKKLLNRRQFRTHTYGLVGFVKELVDECGMADITREGMGRPPSRPSKFREMRISPGHVFIVKE
jgi:hypothetical protein